MKTVTAIVLLALLAALLVYAAVTLARAARRRKAPWRLVEDSDGELLAVYADRPGHDRLLLGSVPIAAPDFDSRLYELRAESRQKVSALNDR